MNEIVVRPALSSTACFLALWSSSQHVCSMTKKQGTNKHIFNYVLNTMTTKGNIILAGASFDRKCIDNGEVKTANGWRPYRTNLRFQRIFVGDYDLTRMFGNI